MIDQATELRKQIDQMNLVQVVPDPGDSQIVAVTSGKGGVGKTYVVVNLAIALRRAGHRVAVLDGDFGLANIDVLLGLTPKYHLGHVITGVQALRSIILSGPEGIDIIPASSGIQELAEMGERKRLILLRQLNELLKDYDYVLIDTAAGISDNVIRLLNVAQRVVVVALPEPTAIVDAYALIKVLFRRDPEKDVQLLVNAVSDAAEAEDVHRQLSYVIDRFLGRTIGFLGSIPRDSKVHESIRRQQPLLLSHPRTQVSRCFLRIADALTQCAPVGSRLSRLFDNMGQ